MTLNEEHKMPSSAEGWRGGDPDEGTFQGNKTSTSLLGN